MMNKVLHSPGRFRLLLWLVASLSAFCGPLQISSEQATMKVGLDGYTAVKLLVAMIATSLGLWGYLRDPRVRRFAATWPVLILFAICFLAVLASLRAESTSSFPVAVINAGYVFFVASCLVHLGLQRFLTAVLSGIIVFMMGAWGLYLLVPEMGVYHEQLSGGTVVSRMSGMSHPNMISRSFVIAIVATVYLYRSGSISLKNSLIVIVPAAVALYLAWSRTAIAAGTLALVMLWLDKFMTRGGMVLAVVSSLVLVAVLASITLFGSERDVTDQLLSKLTKTGETSEITSGTGRSEIWAETIHLIEQRPLLGYGFNAAPSLLVDHSQSTHNAFLHITLSTGVIGGALLLLLLMQNVVVALQHPRLVLRALAVFFIVSSVAEETVMETFPGPCTMLWFAVCMMLPKQARQAEAMPAEGDQGSR